MSTLIPIPESAANSIKDLLLTDLAEKRERLKAIELECKELEYLITQLSPTQNLLHGYSEIQEDNISALASELGYKDTWTWERKIKFIMEYKANVGLTTTEIVSTLIELEPNVKKNRSKIVASISAIISTKSKGGKAFYKEINDRNENVYYLSPF